MFGLYKSYKTCLAKKKINYLQSHIAAKLYIKKKEIASVTVSDSVPLYIAI